MTALFDTHCHLQDAAFDGDAEGAIRRALDAGVAGMLLCGYDRESNARTLELAAVFPQAVFAAAGYHPHEAGKVTAEMRAELETQAARPEVVAIGEIGLDHYWDNTPRDAQDELLAWQLDLALRLGKPISVHSRGAEDAIFAPLAAYAARSPLMAGGRAPGIMHCFGGSLAQAQRFAGLGFLISIACVITYPKNTEARAIAANLPLESFVIETDSPYLPPQSMRGKRNEPAFVCAAAEGLAAARGITVAEAAEATTQNACRALGVTIRIPVEAR